MFWRKKTDSEPSSASSSASSSSSSVPVKAKGLPTDYVSPRERLKDEKYSSLVLAMKERLNFPLDGPFIPEHGLPITDVTILRFLLARELNLDLAAELLKNFIQWRNNLGEVTYEGLEHILKQGTFHYHGYSHTGSPLLIIQPSRFVPALSNVQQLIRINTLVIEELIAGNPTGEAYSSIIDFDGFGLSNMSYEQVKPLIDIWNNYYPEVIEVEYFINANWILRTLWSWAKPLLPERTKKKIVFLGTDYKDVLSTYISLDQLEKRLGGTSEWVHADWESATVEDRKLGIIQCGYSEQQDESPFVPDETVALKSSLDFENDEQQQASVE